jgi:hypothetical protein
MKEFRLLLVILFATIYPSISSAQNIRYSIDSLSLVLNKEHKCKIEIRDTGDKNGVTITTWGYSRPLVYGGKCLYIKYSIECDASGSSFYRELYIPYTLINKKKIEKGDIVYYQDRWGGKGTHFDPQGGCFEANGTIKEIIKCIQR